MLKLLIWHNNCISNKYYSAIPVKGIAVFLYVANRNLIRCRSPPSVSDFSYVSKKLENGGKIHGKNKGM